MLSFSSREQLRRPEQRRQGDEDAAQDERCPAHAQEDFQPVETSAPPVGEREESEPGSSEEERQYVAHCREIEALRVARQAGEHGPQVAEAVRDMVGSPKTRTSTDSEDWITESFLKDEKFLTDVCLYLGRRLTRSPC